MPRGFPPWCSASTSCLVNSDGKTSFTTDPSSGRGGKPCTNCRKGTKWTKKCAVRCNSGTKAEGGKKSRSTSTSKTKTFNGHSDWNEKRQHGTIVTIESALLMPSTMCRLLEPPGCAREPTVACSCNLDETEHQFYHLVCSNDARTSYAESPLRGQTIRINRG